MTPSEPPGTAHDLLVLHALRCGGYAGVPRVAAATGLDESVVESELIALGVDGFVTYDAGEFGGWGLTDAGRDTDAERIAAELEAADARPVATAVYEQFLVLNPELLDLCTAWQMQAVDGAMTVNDHRDAGYDARILDRFADLHRRADATLAPLVAALPRFGRHLARLTEALDRANAGELDHVADGTASYHAVWATLHEDLLATLGMRRW